MRTSPPTTTPTTSPMATLTLCEPIVGFVDEEEEEAAVRVGVGVEFMLVGM